MNYQCYVKSRIIYYSEIVYVFTKRFFMNS